MAGMLSAVPAGLLAGCVLRSATALNEHNHVPEQVVIFGDRPVALQYLKRKWEFCPPRPGQTFGLGWLQSGLLNPHLYTEIKWLDFHKSQAATASREFTELCSKYSSKNQLLPSRYLNKDLGV